MIRFFLLMLFFAFPAMAAEEKPKEEGADPAVTEDFCRLLALYRPVDGVDFVPGADDVVPADLDTAQSAQYGVVSIPLSLPLAERFPDMNIPEELELEPNVGMISVFGDGRVAFNGKDLTYDAQVICGYIEDPAHGLDEKDAVKSEKPINAKAKKAMDGAEVFGHYP